MQGGVALKIGVLYGLYRKGDVSGREWHVVVPGYASPEFEIVNRAVWRDLPLGRKGRQQAPGIVQGCQPIEYQPAQVLIYRVVLG